MNARTVLVSLLLVALAAPALAQPTAIFAAQGPLSQFEGLTFESFDRPARSPNGQHWMLLARTTADSSEEALYITGQGTTGTLQIREGVTDIVDGRVPEFMSDRRVGINNNGDWAVTLGLDGSSSDDELVLRSIGGVREIVAREGQTVPANTNWTYGSSNAGVNIDADGDVAYVFRVAGDGISSSNDSTYFLDNGSQYILQENTTTFDNPVDTSFYVADNGTDWLAVGDNPNGTDIVRVNGADVLAEGQAVPGLDPGTYGNAARFYLPEMASNGDWYARGRNDDAAETGWAVRNGELLARSGETVPGGEAGETWDSSVWTSSSGVTFFHFSGNNNGDYIVGGFTSLADGERNAAWVLNGEEVVLRNGDQVDLDGDGFLDNAFIHFSSLTTASPTAVGGFLTDDMYFYFTADIRNGAGQELGEAFLRVLVPEPGSLGLLALVGLVALRRR